VTGQAGQSLFYRLPDSGNPAQVLQNLPAIDPLNLNYPIPEPITARSFAALITRVLVTGQAVHFRLLLNNLNFATITFGPTEGGPGSPKFSAIGPLPYAAGQLIAVQVEVENVPAADGLFLASAMVGFA
jgi:hypothetical protein